MKQCLPTPGHDAAARTEPDRQGWRPRDDRRCPPPRTLHGSDRVPRLPACVTRCLLLLAYGIWLAHFVRSILPSPVGQSHPARWAYSSCHKPYAICHKPEWGVLLLGRESSNYPVVGCPLSTFDSHYFAIPFQVFRMILNASSMST